MSVEAAALWIAVLMRTGAIVASLAAVLSPEHRPKLLWTVVGCVVLGIIFAAWATIGKPAGVSQATPLPGVTPTLLPTVSPAPSPIPDNLPKSPRSPACNAMGST